MATITPPQIFQALQVCRTLEKQYALMKQHSVAFYQDTVTLRLELEEAAAHLRSASDDLQAKNHG